jgi:predicted Zn-dependent protease with MMP-like domain
LVVSITPNEFERLVGEALDSLPQQFAKLLHNVVVVVEDEPSEEDLDLAGENELLGIFRVEPPLPDQIAIFRKPILRIARNQREAIAEVRETVIHELGHYFGLNDDEMIY